MCVCVLEGKGRSDLKRVVGREGNKGDGFKKVITDNW
jgi:hypothetical protein